MPGASRCETFAIPIEKIFDVIVDYAYYPKLLGEVDSVEIIEQNETSALVKYNLQLIKTFSYVLRLEHERPHRVTWQLDSGDFFKSNNGSWTLTKEGDDRTKIDYEIDINFKIFAPKMITEKIVAHNLPKMMQAFYERALEI